MRGLVEETTKPPVSVTAMGGAYSADSASAPHRRLRWAWARLEVSSPAQFHQDARICPIEVVCGPHSPRRSS